MNKFYASILPCAIMAVTFAACCNKKDKPSQQDNTTTAVKEAVTRYTAQMDSLTDAMGPIHEQDSFLKAQIGIQTSIHDDILKKNKVDIIRFDIENNKDRGVAYAVTAMNGQEEVTGLFYSREKEATSRVGKHELKR